MATEYTVSINEILKDTLPELPGIVRSVALREFRLTMRDFFEKTFAWTTVVKDVAISTGETPIQVDDSDANSTVIGILNVSKGNAIEGYRVLAPLTERPPAEATATNPDFWYVSSNPDELVLYPYLDVATTDDLTVTVALMPAMDIDEDANTLPRQVMLKYHDVLIEGFLARVYEHPNKPYSAPMVAQQKRHNYNRSRGFYASQRRSGNSPASSWAYPRGWVVARGRS